MSPMKMLSSPSSSVCTSTRPNTVLRRMTSAQWAHSFPDEPRATESFACRIDDAVGDACLHRIEPRLVALDLNRADDAVFDRDAERGIRQRQARLRWPLRAALAIEPPAGDQRAVADRDARDLAVDLHPASGDNHAVEHEPAFTRAGHSEAIRGGASQSSKWITGRTRLPAEAAASGLWRA